jgi:tRNA threonylcarbamoyladenosine biosynthesis protein TsaE
MIEIEIHSLKEIHKAAREFIQLTKGRRQFAFYGPIGAGKTTLIKAICKELGAEGLVTSPSFALVNEYSISDEVLAYHFDLYRINSIEELYDLGYEEYFYGPNYLFVEWAEKAESLLPESIVKVTLEETDPETRIVRIML